MRKNSKKSNINGMTLIEVIVSLAIFGIIAVAFLNVFVSGFLGVISSGKRTEVGYLAQQAVEETINEIDIGSDKVTIVFSGGPTLEVEGNTIVQEVNNGKESITITTFIPNR